MITGVYKPLAGRAANLSGHFRSVVVTNSVEQLSQATQASADISTEDLQEMKELAAKPDVLDILGRSLAPSIYGHDWIKKVCTDASDGQQSYHPERAPRRSLSTSQRCMAHATGRLAEGTDRCRRSCCCWSAGRRKTC